MGSKGASTRVVQAEETVTPAVAQTVAADTDSALSAQREARARLRGIRGTYARFAGSDGAGGKGSTLG